MNCPLTTPTDRYKVCWIIAPYTQLKIISPKESPLKDIINPAGEIISYDRQINYPHATSIISTARQLQSSLGDKVKLNASILNLAAVPRAQFIDGTWTESYLAPPHKVVSYGNSKIECRRIGLDIAQVSELEAIISTQDLIVTPAPFETHVPELMRLASFLKSRYNTKLLACGTGVESHETELLDSGFDVVFIGTVTDRGEEVLSALIDEDYQKLSVLPGVNSDLGGYTTRNLGARNFRRDKRERKELIRQWKKNLPRYQHFVEVDFKFVGRPDLNTSTDSSKISSDPTIEYCCAMQDLPFGTVAEKVQSRGKVVFAADNLFQEVGCPRTCNFCHASGKGCAKREQDYSFKLLDFYKKLGATDLIPTDDQILLRATTNKQNAEQLASIYRHAQELGFTFFYGNGIETYALATLIELSSKDKAFKKLLNLFTDTAAYIYLPYENIFGLRDDPKLSGLAKLAKGRNGFETVLDYFNFHSPELEVGTNIIFSEEATPEEIRQYYQIMNNLAARYSHLRLRYNGFFMIPSNCAPHINNYRHHLVKKYNLTLSDKYPELKIVNLPTIFKNDEQQETLEQKLAWNWEAINLSATRRKLRGGTYE